MMRMRQVLERAFAPESLEVIDDSARHAGHAGAAAGGGTHFNVAMVAEAFSGMSRLERSRRVHDALADEFSTGLHALSLDLRSPSETNSKKTIRRT